MDTGRPSRSKRRISPRGLRLKGLAFERELADYLSNTLGLAVARTRMTTPIFSEGHVGNPDLIGTPLLAIEAKRQETLEYRKALNQARRNASGSDLGVVINRRSQENINDAVVFMRLSDFVELYRRILVNDGFIKGEPLSPLPAARDLDASPPLAPDDPTPPKD